MDRAGGAAPSEQAKGGGAVAKAEAEAEVPSHERVLYVQ
eukprot:SAG25_NODE_256_length_10933_cov_24.263522_6_plen_39_part_00